MTNHYDQLIKVLREVFQLDRSDLDFGIYRILNQKSEQIDEFLTKRLLVEVKEILKQSGSSDMHHLQEEVETKRKTLIELGVDPEQNEKYKELQAQLAKVSSMDTLEQEVYSHLTNFFKRYYKEGDFISLRRYKNDTYAIPYEGEEVKLYRANHDQYYIKTTENLKNYAFYVGPNKEQKVIFRLVEASTEQNNNKAQTNKERRFALYEEHPFDEEGEVLIINCTYDVYDKSVTQKSLTDTALEVITNTLPKKFQPLLLTSLPTESNKKRTVIEKHFNDFTTKHTFDYFIHKDLEGFLSRELDFYIKNEILHIDDIDSTNESHFVSQLSKIKALKQVASKIITMLAQVENFQKKLREKKKFVTNAQYCITIDKIPESYYNDILQNKEQLEERKKLYSVTIKTLEDLKNDPYLVLDTKFFSPERKEKFLAEFDNIDEECDGLLINSENWQALNLIQEKYREQVKCTYIDPPYNTSASEIIYKNSYKHSSWASFMQNRIIIGKNLMSAEGIINITIDYAELWNLGKISDQIFGTENRLGIVTIFINPKGRQHERFFSSSVEYMLVYSNNHNLAEFNKITIDEEKKKLFIYSDDNGKYRLDNFARIRSSTTNEKKPKFYYPIYVSKDLKDVTLIKNNGYYEIFPTDNSGNKYSRKCIPKSFIENNKKGLYVPKYDENGILKIYNKFYEQQVFKNIWTDKKYFPEFQGTNLLKDVLGNSIFSYPKSIFAVSDTLKIITNKNCITLDYFAGSGTTGHAVIKLNREDGGNRKYILIEMGEYFDTVTKPRIQKVIYSDNRKEGKPKDKNGISQMFKYLELESYEDTLNNLVLQKTDKQQALLTVDSNLNDQYMLHYMLDTESRDHLLSVKDFINPFNYTLAITKQNETKTTAIDLVETFNYLIGLHIEKQRSESNCKCILGHTRDEKKMLIIRRNQETTNNTDLNTIFESVRKKIDTNTLDVIYVNGDTMLENIRQKNEKRSVKLTEQIFLEQMFSPLS